MKKEYEILPMRHSRMNLCMGILVLLLCPIGWSADKFTPQYDETKVPAYTLPDPLVCFDGTVVKNEKTWREKRRPEILKMFKDQMFGHSPGLPEKTSVAVRTMDPAALSGKAVRKEIRITFEQNGKTAQMDLLLYLPSGVHCSVPVFLGLNFWGNQSIHNDPGISISEQWFRENEEYGIVNHRATEATRGVKASRWPVEQILQRGYGLATVYYGDLARDDVSTFDTGIFPLFFKPGQTKPAPDQWGAIGAWAWTLRRAMDYLQTDKQIDASRVAVLGHSRLGKTALWAGATDPRFAMVISNCSGCGGVALSKRCFGETLNRINTKNPHWFCDNFKPYNDRENSLPFDQHMLLALIAPRSLYIASASEDLWADPKGEFLSALHADPVYRLLKTEGLPIKEFPPINQPARGTIAYHLRQGKHDITEYDWQQYLLFADKHFQIKTSK